MEILNEQKQKYLSRRLNELDQLKNASTDEDLFSKAVEIGHRLKGNGKTFGYPMISEIGLRLEAAGKIKDKTIIRNEITDLEKEVHSAIAAVS